MRLLHTMLRVGDLQRSIEFYTNVLGMKLLRDQLESEKRDDDPQILTDALNENIKLLDELIEGIENEEFFLTLEMC